MSIEWFTMMSMRNGARRRPDPLADPLESEDWKKLGWVATGIARLLSAPSGKPPQKNRKGSIPLVPAKRAAGIELDAKA